ncbi:hypothetical protein VIGAN_09043400 [Vigna angularis var. angularis]|uniref:Uncharacterized protein n=1 Tax=Vigna angularis var. angularis TaxID=157739 RepID=A0A0S3SVZ8_PHAAN|nr:hypothetical protein VIGAN_09043400 [Vigna angularis var. angularis]
MEEVNEVYKPRGACINPMDEVNEVYQPRGGCTNPMDEVNENSVLSLELSCSRTLFSVESSSSILHQPFIHLSSPTFSQLSVSNIRLKPSVTSTVDRLFSAAVNHSSLEP